MKEISKKYGFITATAMIVGICIGSGIFFKSDNILIATGGSILWGIVLFVVSAISIVFGCLTFGELASQTDQVGGLLSYSEEFLGSKAGCGYGWFQILVYYPSITAVVSWVIGIYTCILFGLPGTLGLQLLIGFAFLCICFTYNVLVPKFGAGVQNATTAIKLIPLLILAICGLIFGDPATGFAAVDPRTVAGASILTALGPIAYSFDGWIVATSISHEVHDSRRNMPRALLFRLLLIVLTMYVLYFVGVSCYVGPMEVIRLGDEHVSVAAERLLGAWFSKAIVAFVVVSVVGTVNGLVTGFIRMPYSIAVREGMFPMRKTLSKLDKHGMPGCFCSDGISAVHPLAVHPRIGYNQRLAAKQRCFRRRYCYELPFIYPTVLESILPVERGTSYQPFPRHGLPVPGNHRFVHHPFWRTAKPDVYCLLPVLRCGSTGWNSLLSGTPQKSINKNSRGKSSAVFFCSI